MRTCFLIYVSVLDDMKSDGWKHPGRDVVPDGDLFPIEGFSYRTLEIFHSSEYFRHKLKTGSDADCLSI